MIIVQLLEFDSVCQISKFSNMLHTQKYINNPSNISFIFYFLYVNMLI